jgi:hypothetical protein
MIKNPITKNKNKYKRLMSDVTFLNILIDYTLEKSVSCKKEMNLFYRFKKLNY